MSDRPTLLVTHRRSEEFTAAFREALADRLGHDPVERATTPAETRDRIEDATALLATHVPEEWLDRAGHLSWVQTASAGVDHLDRDAFRERGIALTNGSGVHAEPIAEQVLGYLLAFERGLHTGFRQQNRGVWERFEGGEVRGKTLGVVGLGAIGSRVAELGSALGMDVVGTKRDTSEGPDAADEIHSPDDLHEVLTRVDYLVLACPLTEETEGLIGRDELGLLDDDAILVNIARGEVVDEDALVRALRGHQIGGAGLDVFETEPLPEESPLWDLSNVIVTPHMAGSNPHKAERLAEIVAHNYERFAAGELDDMRNRVV